MGRVRHSGRGWRGSIEPVTSMDAYYIVPVSRNSTRSLWNTGMALCVEPDNASLIVRVRRVALQEEAR